MAESLRDQLLKSGLVKEIREEARKSAPPPRQGQGPNQGKDQGGRGGQRPQGGNRPGQGAGRRQQGQGRQQEGRPGGGKGGNGGQGQRPPRNDGEMYLARAYAMRAQTEASERRKAEAEAAEQALSLIHI